MRQFHMAIRRCAAMPRDMLDNGHDPAGHQPIAHRLTQPGNHRRVVRKCPIADNFMTIRRRKVKNRGTVHVDAKRCQVIRNETAIELNASRRLLDITDCAFAEWPHGRVFGPMRRPQTLYAAAFLIDHYEHIFPPDRLTKRRRQIANLIRRTDIPCKQYKTNRIRLTKELPFVF